MIAVLQWLHVRAERRRIRRAEQEAADFLSGLSGFGLADLGLIAALTAHVAHQFAEAGDDLLQPAAAAQKNPMLLWMIEEMVLRLQRSGKHVFVPGFMVWSHTLRALDVLKLIRPAKQIWHFIGAGFEHADAAAVDFYLNQNFELNVEAEFLRFPVGFDPRDLA